jgi:hypothetical protein
MSEHTISDEANSIEASIFSVHATPFEDLKRDLQHQLKPLVSGSLRTAKRAHDTGYKWLDNTAEEIRRIRRLIAELDAAIEFEKAKGG